MHARFEIDGWPLPRKPSSGRLALERIGGVPRPDLVVDGELAVRVWAVPDLVVALPVPIEPAAALF
jgi:hypothetical protein